MNEECGCDSAVTCALMWLWPMDFAIVCILDISFALLLFPFLDVKTDSHSKERGGRGPVVVVLL